MATLTEVFPCFFLSCKVKCQGKTRKDEARLALFLIFCVVLCIFCVVLCIVCFVSFSVLFVCMCVLYYCHRVATQLQLNIYHIIRIIYIYIYIYIHTHTHTHKHIVLQNEQALNGTAGIKAN
jgi:membrane protein implicated in regulation of membrane protease activity